MHASQCDGCTRVWRKVTDLERDHVLHQMVIDGKVERDYCNDCLKALFEWEASRRMTDDGAPAKPERLGVLRWLIARVRLWIMRRIMVEVPRRIIVNERIANLEQRLTEMAESERKRTSETEFFRSG